MATLPTAAAPLAAAEAATRARAPRPGRMWLLQLWRAARERLQARPCLPRPPSGRGSAHSRLSRQMERAERRLSRWAPYCNSTATSPWVRKQRRYQLHLRLQCCLCIQQCHHHPAIQPLSKTYVRHAMPLLSLTANLGYV
jgi:hypothetical protein